MQLVKYTPVGLVGKKGSGKTSIAKKCLTYFNDIGYVCGMSHYADDLKGLCCKYFGVKQHLAWGSQEDKEQLSTMLWENMPIQTDRKGLMTVREVLQYVGTELFRKVNPNIWVDRLFAQIESDHKNIKYKLVFIPDTRFPNEIEAIQSRGGIVMKVVSNRTIEGDGHASEVALDSYNIPFVVDNNGTLEESVAQVHKYLYESGKVLPF